MSVDDSSPYNPPPFVSLIHVSRSVVFAFSKDKELRMTDTIDELVDQMIGICQACPEFLHPEDAKRYSFFLQALKNWDAPADPEYWRMGNGIRAVRPGQPSVRAGELPIRALALILPYWIMSFIAAGLQLMSHYALDAAVFMKSMIGGHRNIYPEPWRTEPLLWPDGIGFINFTKSFKREFTLQTHLMVVAAVPEGVNVMTHFRDENGENGSEVRLEAGVEFMFEVRRCHLSESLTENSVLTIEPVPPPRFDIADEFRLKGRILGLFMEADRVHEEDWSYAESFFDLPARWITHEILYEGLEPPYDCPIIPLPAWDLAVGNIGQQDEGH